MFYIGTALLGLLIINYVQAKDLYFDCDCPKEEYTPVCGSNGKTYMNECQFLCAQMRIKDLWRVKYGRCNDRHQKIEKLQQGIINQCRCPLDVHPVCGSDGKTYQNTCFLECQQFYHDSSLIMMFNGSCEQGPIDKKVQENMLPYDSPSFDWCRCSHDVTPVCGSDGKTYQNKCFLQCQRFYSDHTLFELYYGECKQNTSPEPPFSCRCPTDIRIPVCGSDGKTYQNKCFLQCQRLFHNHTLFQLYEGECKRRPQLKTMGTKVTVECLCQKKGPPVCASDGKTYFNECAFNCVHVFYPEIKLEYYGKCVTDWDTTLQGPMTDQKCHCPATFEPVCGSDGQKYITYRNKCVFECTQLLYPPKVPGMRLVHEGKCMHQSANLKAEVAPTIKQAGATCKCPLEPAPVCGSDGVTYLNDCHLICRWRRADMTDRKVYKIRDGACEVPKMSVGKYSSPVYEIGEEEPVTKNCVCPLEVFPVCGSDNVTYKNECWFRCEKMYFRKTLFIAYIGKCHG